MGQNSMQLLGVIGSVFSAIQHAIMSDTAAEADFDRAGRGVWYLFLASVAISTLSGILLFLPPWQVYATDRYRLFWIVILVGVAGWSFLSGGRVRLGKLCAAGLTTFSVLGLISALQAPLPRYALLEWAHFIGSALLGLGVFQYVRQNKMQAFKGLNQAVFFAVYTYTLFYLLWYFTQVRCEQLFCVQLQLPAFNNPRTFDTLFQPLLLLYPLTINHLPDRRPIRWAYWILGAIWFSLLFVSSGRANFLVILLICPMIFVVAPSVGLPWIKRLGVFLLFGGIAYVLLHGVWPYLTGAFVEPGPRSRLFSLAGYGREELWYRAWIIFLEHPIMGGGPMHFSYDVEIPLAINAHPHNLALQILSEWGIFCALLFLLMYFFC